MADPDPDPGLSTGLNTGINPMSPDFRPLRPPGGSAARRRSLLFLPALLVLVLSWVLRHGLIEPSAWAHACEASPWNGVCALRSAVIASFVRGEIGWAALVAGVLALFLCAPRLGSLALALGAGGLVLYSYEPAALGALLGLLVIVRRSAAAPPSAAVKTT